MSAKVYYQAVATGSVSLLSFFTALHAWFNASSDFTIVASSNVGTTSGWFVVQMDGQPWQLWFGAATTTPTWHSANMHTSFSSYYLYYSFAPSGGWAVGTNTPGTSGAMFSNYQANSGRANKIQRWLMNNISSNTTYYATIVYDTSLGFLSILLADGSAYPWYHMLAVGPMISNLPDSDPYPYAAFAGIPGIATSYAAFYQPYTGVVAAGGSSIYSAVLKPSLTVLQDGASGVIDKVELDAYNQPNYAGTYDWFPLAVRNNVNGEAHFRGVINPGWCRQVAGGLADRTFLDAKTWIVLGSAGGNYRVAIPWDGVTNL